ncbi:gibberellin-regulated protein 11-like, partial [Impatiens glandulifera]|uniref:gibberellin-regulated protein 11-like n=1 Tax=Impatiens glandulifera TaxID=253017 RepID=UPI001FB18A5B
KVSIRILTYIKLYSCQYRTFSFISNENIDSVFYLQYIIDRSDCGAACSVRCSLSSRPRLCQRACGTCCGRCKCVPPGTYGNYDSCPCYGNMTTRGNRRKCP